MTAEPTRCNLIVEMKGYRGDNAKEKANDHALLLDTRREQSPNFGRWAFAEFTAVYEMEAEFNRLVDTICTEKAAA